MTKLTVFTNSHFDGGFFGFAFTGGLWLYCATGPAFRRDPSSASSYPHSREQRKPREAPEQRKGTIAGTGFLHPGSGVFYGNAY